MRVRPVPVEVDDVGMLELREAFEHLSDLVLLSLVVLPFRELHLVPHHLHAFLRVHGQVRAVDPGHIPLLHLMKISNVTARNNYSGDFSLRNREDYTGNK